MSAAPPTGTPPVPGEPPTPRRPVVPSTVRAVAVPYRAHPRRGVLITALVVAVVLLVGSVGATVAWAHADTRAPFGIARLGDSRTEHGRMFWRVPAAPQQDPQRSGPGRRSSPECPSFPAPGPTAAG